MHGYNVRSKSLYSRDEVRQVDQDVSPTVWGSQQWLNLPAFSFQSCLCMEDCRFAKLTRNCRAATCKCFSPTPFTVTLINRLQFSGILCFVTQRCRCCHHLQSALKAALAQTCACLILEGTYERTSNFAFLYLSPPIDPVMPIFLGIGRQEITRLKVILVSVVATSEGQNCVLYFAVGILTSSSTIPISIVPVNAVFAILKFASHWQAADLPKTLGVVPTNAEWVPVCAYFVTILRR